MKAYKKLFIILALVLILSAFGDNIVKASSIPADAPFKVTIDGNAVNFTEELGKPFLTNTQRTMVPLRIISEGMGYEVDWERNGAKNEAYVKGNGVEIFLRIGENTAKVNGWRVPIDVQDGKTVDTKAMLVPVKGSSRTYVPLRFISESLGAEIKYNQKNGIHYIDIITKEVEEEIIQDVEFVEPEFKVTQLTDAKHVHNYFTIRLVNREDYKDIGINISTELTNWPDFVEYSRKAVIGKEYVIINENEYHKNWDYDSIRAHMGSIYGLVDMTRYKKADGSGPVSIPEDGYILKYIVTVTIGNKTKVYNMDIPFYNKIFEY